MRVLGLESYDRYLGTWVSLSISHFIELIDVQISLKRLCSVYILSIFLK